MQKDYEGLKLKNQLCFPLYAVSREIVSLYTPYLKPFSLTYTQYIAFMVLWEEQSIKTGMLCDILHLDNGTITPVLKKLENDGYVVRERKKDDERCVYVTITKKGNDLKDKLSDIPFKVGECIKGIDDEEKKQLYTILYKMLNAKKENL